VQGTEIISYLTITVVRFLYIMLSYWGARSPFWRPPISTTNIATTLDILKPSTQQHPWYTVTLNIQPQIAVNKQWFCIRVQMCFRKGSFCSRVSEYQQWNYNDITTTCPDMMTTMMCWYNAKMYLTGEGFEEATCAELMQDNTHRWIPMTVIDLQGLSALSWCFYENELQILTGNSLVIHIPLLQDFDWLLYWAGT